MKFNAINKKKNSYKYFVFTMCENKQFHLNNANKTNIMDRILIIWDVRVFQDRFGSELQIVQGCFLLNYFFSAGVGRTGTYIALDALYREGETTGKINVPMYVRTMRKDRMNMIQGDVWSFLA